MTRKLLFFAMTVAWATTACASAEEVGRSYAGDDGIVEEISLSKVISPEVPENVTFAGDEISFDRTDMYERLDRELTSIAYSHGSTMLLLKRANKYFPVMAPILKKHGVPLDFLYLACVESSLNPRAMSPVKAAGFWQFMPATAKEYGLEVNDHVDERYNLEKSTEAAAKYLKKAYQRYGNWESVAASYNGGMGRVTKELASQKQTSAFDLYLTEETSRYMFRLLAMKLIMENPADYGYVIEDSQLYRPVKTKSIEVDYTIDDLPQWAIEHGTSYQWVRELNPWIRSKTLPNKSGKKYVILIPDGKDAVNRSNA